MTKGLTVLSELEQRLEQQSARGLATAVSRAIRDGVLPPGSRLPPIRSVARRLAMSPTTVSAGWALLIRSGAIRTDGRRGTTVARSGAGGAARYRQALEHESPFELDLSTGVPDDDLLPHLTNALANLRTAGTPGGYLDEPVLPELRDALLGEWPYQATDLMVTDGAMDAMDLVARSTVRFGDRVIVEHPCFPPAADLFEAVGVELVGVPLDEEGMQVEPLRQALRVPAAAVLLQPRAQNPTGVSISAHRAGELAAALGGTDTLVIEDDSSGAISTSEAVSLGRWLPGQTVHVRSFSKSYGPDLRLAGMTGPPELMAALASRRLLGQGWSSRLLQRILLSLLTDETATAQVAHARDEYARRRSVVVTELGRLGVPVGGTDGINIWVPVRDETACMVRLASQGIGVTPGAPFGVLSERTCHVRVTVGQIKVHQREVAASLAEAARAAGWGSRAR